MNVFVFSDGERHEGHTVRSVHLTIDGAQAAASSQWERDLSRDWEQVSSKPRAWKADIGACDEAWIEEKEVLP